MAKSSNAKSFVERANSALAANQTPAEAWRKFMISQGASGGNQTALENSWLRIKGGKGSTNSDLWNSYLQTKGFTVGGLNERKASFFRAGSQA